MFGGGGGGGGEGAGATHSIRMGRDVLTKGVLFSESVWNRVFHCKKKSGNKFKYICLERVHVCLERGW